MNRLVNAILVVAMIAGVATVYDMKYEAAEADRELTRLQADVEAERKAISMLRAEWALLNQPDRLAKLVADNDRVFQLQVMRMDQIVPVEQVTGHIDLWAVPEDDRLVPSDAVDPIGLMALRAAAEGAQ